MTIAPPTRVLPRFEPPRSTQTESNPLKTLLRIVYSIHNTFYQFLPRTPRATLSTGSGFSKAPTISPPYLYHTSTSVYLICEYSSATITHFKSFYFLVNLVESRAYTIATPSLNHLTIVKMSDNGSNSNSSRHSSRSRTPLSLDLSAVPPFQPPTPPSNTLIITNLNDPSIFHVTNLQTIKDLINEKATIHTWAPLKSFRRIIVSFYSKESAICIRQVLDGEVIMGEQVKIYFGKETPIGSKDEHLALPDAGKLFFISPPPSPPHGWQMKLEDAPNKQVHAEDLAEALAKLHARPNAMGDLNSPVSDGEEGNRKRSGSTTMIYHPKDHGDSPALPAIAVEDFTDVPDSISPIEGGPILAHTARPPVELMHHS